jgi:hypothetical protein
MKRTFRIIMSIVLLFLCTCCGESNATEIPTLPDIPLPTPIFTTAPSPTPRPTNTSIPTPASVFIPLGSPFAYDCGDGVPRIWSNHSLNGGGDHPPGHVDFFVPKNCNIFSYDSEFTSPITGTLVRLRDYTYKIHFPDGVYPIGLIEALEFTGVSNPDLSKVENLRLNLGHIEIPESFLNRTVEKGQNIGNVVVAMGHHKIAYQIGLTYQGVPYWLSPTLFPNFLSDGTILEPMLDGTSTNWICISNSPYTCIPEPNYISP